ncbi:MAG: 4Fe-4S dicluster domain-containing protein, partial [Anaerotruncus massiliensis (ex Togo et al. 2019)]
TYPVLKNNNALLAFDESQTAVYEEQPCIRCGRCIQACPYHLMPRMIEKAYESDNIPMLQKLKVSLCMECGCCSFVCPAKRNLTFTNKMAKQKLRAATAKK